MNTRSLKVPQSYCATKPNNAVKASLSRAGSRDWVVICSDGELSRILIFWNARPDSILEIERYKDSEVTFECAGVRYGYGTALSVMSPARIRYRYAQNEVTVPPGIDHDAIDVWACEKGSNSYFWRKGKREELIGAD